MSQSVLDSHALSDVRNNDTMKKQGFMVIPFPRELLIALQQHIGNFIRRLSEDKHLSLTEIVTSLPDPEFVGKFHKAFRIFPDSIGSQMHSWASKFSRFLGGEQVSINYVCDSEREKNPTLKQESYDIFWRCVRPGKPDVGKPHCDYQFWEIAKGTKDEPICPIQYTERWKIWLPISGCNQTNSLQVIPGSHNEEIPIEIIQTKYGAKPDIRDEWLKKNENRFICPLEQFADCCILFHDKLVHRGPANHNTDLRMSGELTMLLKL